MFIAELAARISHWEYAVLTEFKMAAQAPADVIQSLHDSATRPRKFSKELLKLLLSAFSKKDQLQADEN